MKFTNLITLFIVCAFPAHAQHASDFKTPDYVAIKRATHDPSSPAYYPKLFARYEANDTTLTHQDYSMLYYGRFFQQSKGDDSSTSYALTIKALRQKDVLSDDDKKNFMDLLKKALKSDPFNLHYLNMLSHLYGNDPNAVRYLRKFDMIVDDIMETGDGVSSETAMHVLSIPDEYAVLATIGFKFTGNQSLVEGKCDFLEVQENKFGIKGIYFNVEQILEQERNMLNGGK